MSWLKNWRQKRWLKKQAKDAQKYVDALSGPNTSMRRVCMICGTQVDSGPCRCGSKAFNVILK